MYAREFVSHRSFHRLPTFASRFYVINALYDPAKNLTKRHQTRGLIFLVLIKFLNATKLGDKISYSEKKNVM